MSKKRGRKKVILVFGESDNDRQSICELARALRPKAPQLEKRRSPLVLIKDADDAGARKRAEDIARVVRAEEVDFKVCKVLAHEDCDEVEPAHRALSRKIEDALAKVGVNALAVTPAWEIEAWWFLWPDAVKAYRSKWRKPSRSGQHLGKIKNAKEAFRRAVRPKDGKVPDYRESDSPGIAAKVSELELIDELDARSDSFDLFSTKFRAAKL